MAGLIDRQYLWKESINVLNFWQYIAGIWDLSLLGETQGNFG